jgi:hypothetical protein
LSTGCHGPHLSGGPIPGSPPALPTPLNITPDATGLRDWTFDDFQSFVNTGVRKNGQRINPFMPVEALRAMNSTELHALWAYLRSVPSRPSGQR